MQKEKNAKKKDHDGGRTRDLQIDATDSTPEKKLMKS